MRQILSNITAFIFITSAGLLFLAYILNRRLFPLALQTVAVSSAGEINKAVNAALAAFSIEASSPTGVNAYKPSDFYFAEFDGEGKLASIAANPITANMACADVARKITEDMENLGETTVKIPLGAALGGGLFNAVSPGVPITVQPVGAVFVDYMSELNSSGINRVNYKIWLNVKVEVRVVNAMRDCRAAVTRKVALVDAVFPGEVPNVFIER